MGYPALALGDRDGLYGAPRFYHAAVKAGLKAIVGAELTLDDDSRLYVLVPDRDRYQNLCRLITASKLRVINHLVLAAKRRPRLIRPKAKAGSRSMTWSASAPALSAWPAEFTVRFPGC